MSLNEKLDEIIWSIGAPVAGYLAFSGMDALSKNISYKESLITPVSTMKLVLYGIIALSYIEVYGPKRKK